MGNTQCTEKEKMVVYAARELKPFNKEQAIIGIGLPVLAAKLAKSLWCPELSLIIENGSFDITLAEIPFSLFGARLTYGCSSQLDNLFALSGPRRGRTKIGFLGAAQIDKHGNINTTQIGEPTNMKARIAGSGGAVDIGGYAENIFVILEQKRRNFVPYVDYVTTPGWWAPDHSSNGERKHRKELGLTGGPRAVITNLGIMRFNEQGEMYLSQYYPGVNPKVILENTGFDLDISRAVEAEPVTEEEVAVLRSRIDPLNLYRTR